MPAVAIAASTPRDATAVGRPTAMASLRASMTRVSATATLTTMVSR